MASTRVIVMRHAKSDWYSGEAQDFLRPLAERGVRDAKRMGRWLARAGHLPARVVSSPAKRTRETLSRVSQGAGLDLTARTEWLDEIYLASREELIALLERERDDGPLMLLGHNPGLEELVAWLLPASAIPAGFTKSFPTGAVYVLDLPGAGAELGPGCARLVEHQRPKHLEG